MSDYIILGIQFGGHDTSAALMINGELVAACEQERLDLQKHSRAFPIDAINECLKIGKKTMAEVSTISVGGDFIELIKNVYLKPAIKENKRIDFLIKDIERIKIFYQMENKIRNETKFNGQINFFRHHKCHLASTYYPSGFDKALLVSYDGVGEIESGMIGRASNGEIEILHDSVHYPHSLGLLYSAITFFLGWKHHCDEGIIMGLAPFGNYSAIVPGSKRTYLEVFEEIVVSTGPLNYEINLEWIEYHNKRNTWVSDKFKSIFGKKRDYDEEILDHHKNIAAALQKRLEDVILAQLSYCKKKYNLDKLCISGGVGLNCSLNGKIVSSGIFKEIFVQPASGDSGISVGALYLANKENCKGNYNLTKNHNFYIGTSASDEEIEDSIIRSGQSYEKPINFYNKVATYLSEGKIVAWFQGGAEFGPRALGNRSILSRPYPVEQRDHINKRVKFREEFRPFAPAVLEEFTGNFFDIKQESPHMLIACKVLEDKKSAIPAVVHIDDTCRVQTVNKKNNEKFYNLLFEFNKVTGCPVLLNTSFNVKGQPIVNTATQAIDTFISTKIDALAIGSYILFK